MAVTVSCVVWFPAMADAPTLHDVLREVRGINARLDDHGAQLDGLRAEMATREDLAAVRAEMATREDLAAVRAEMATREDLAAVRAEMATREDLAAVRAEMATREDLAAVRAEMATREDLAAVRARPRGSGQRRARLRADHGAQLEAVRAEMLTRADLEALRGDLEASIAGRFADQDASVARELRAGLAEVVVAIENFARPGMRRTTRRAY